MTTSTFTLANPALYLETVVLTEIAAVPPSTLPSYQVTLNRPGQIPTNVTLSQEAGLGLQNVLISAGYAQS